jgi:hypothetical protein
MESSIGAFAFELDWSRAAFCAQDLIEVEQHFVLKTSVVSFVRAVCGPSGITIRITGNLEFCSYARFAAMDLEDLTTR